MACKAGRYYENMQYSITLFNTSITIFLAMIKSDLMFNILKSYFLQTKGIHSGHIDEHSSLSVARECMCLCVRKGEDQLGST